MNGEFIVVPNKIIFNHWGTYYSRIVDEMFVATRSRAGLSGTWLATRSASKTVQKRTSCSH